MKKFINIKAKFLNSRLRVCIEHEVYDCTDTSVHGSVHMHMFHM